MNLRRTFKVSWEGLTLNKVRSFLTTLGVIIGVAAVIVMLAVSAGAEAEIADQINSLGANLIMVMPSFSRGGFGPGATPPAGLSYDDIAVLASSLTGINGVICTIFFAIVSWQIAKYATTLFRTGEVTETLRIIYYPFTYGVALGCAVLSLVFFTELLRTLFSKAEDKA